MASVSPVIVPAGCMTFGAHISAKNQYLRANGVANSTAVVDAGAGSAAVVGVRSRLYAVAWQFERNTKHWFQLVKNGERVSDLKFQTRSGVMVLENSNRLTLSPGDRIQIFCYHDWVGNQFPGPIVVSLYTQAL